MKWVVKFNTNHLLFFVNLNYISALFVKFILSSILTEDSRAEEVKNLIGNYIKEIEGLRFVFASLKFLKIILKLISFSGSIWESMDIFFIRAYFMLTICLYLVRAKLTETELMYNSLKRGRPVTSSSRMAMSSMSPLSSAPSRISSSMSLDVSVSPDNSVSALLSEAKKDIKGLKKTKRSISRQGSR